MQRHVLIFALPLVLAPAAAAQDASLQEVRDYAALLGRANGCGYEVDAETRRVLAWIEAHFDDSRRKSIMSGFQAEVAARSRRQMLGKSEVGCDAVATRLDGTDWP